MKGRITAPRDGGEEAYDVVVLGSGIAGLATALACQRHGLRTLVVEKIERLGGGSCHSTGLIWVGCNHLQGASGVIDSDASVKAYVSYLGGGEQVAENMDAFVSESPNALLFFQQCGIPFEIVRNVADHHYPNAPGTLQDGRTLQTRLVSGKCLGEWSRHLVRPRTTHYCVTVQEATRFRGSEWPEDLLRSRLEADICGLGVGLVVHFLHACLKAGVAIRISTDVEEIRLQGDAVSGVVLRSGEAIRAAAVVIATGGYESNAALVDDFEGLPDWKSLYPRSIQGDGLVLGQRAGGGIRVLKNQMQLFLGFPIEPEGGGDAEFRLSGILELCCPHTIVVNKQAERFADESVFQRVAARLRDFDQERRVYSNLPCFLIFDSQFVERFSIGGAPVGQLPAWVERGENLQDLAVRLGIGGRQLQATVDDFNECVANGNDRLFSRRGDPRYPDRQSLGEISKAPYFGAQLYPAGASSAGLLTDRNGQVLSQLRRPIPGLYAAGNAAANTDIGIGYQAGLTLASGMTFGFQIAKHIKSEAPAC